MKEIIAKRKWRYPLSYERDYAKKLTAYVDRKFKIIKAFLPEMRAAIESPSAMNARIEIVIDEIRRAVENAETMTASINCTYQLVDRYNESEFNAIIGSVFGKGTKLNGQPMPGNMDAVDDLAELKDLWVQENLDLIKSIDEDTLQRLKRMMTQAVLDNVNGAELTKYLIDDLQDITGVTRSRAALIGTDQVGKLNGRLSQYRQEHVGITSYIWETCHDSRVRKSHAARNGHRYYWSNPPPDGHPGMPIRCRCVALPVIDVDKIMIKPAPGHYEVVKEEAVIKDNGNRNSYTANLKLMNSKKYRDKFENLTTNKNVDQALYSEATKMIEHRNGTEYEDIAMIDARTGVLIVKDTSASGKNKFKSGLNMNEKKILNEHGGDFEILHNHPGSSIPSRADIIGLFSRPKAKASTIVAHDGTIYRMKKLKPYPDIVELTNLLYNECKEEFSFEPANLIENHAVEKILDFLLSSKYLSYIVR